MASVNVHITADADDPTEEVGGGLVDDGTDYGLAGNVLLGRSGADFDCGLRFLSVGVPQGAVVSAATITLNVTQIGGSPDTTLYGVDVDDAAAFADPGNLPSAATRTTATADLDPSGTGTKVVDVSTIVQEIIDRAGWASGNDMAFVIINNGTEGNIYTLEDYSAAGTNEAQLDVTYTAGGGSTPAQAQMRNYRGIEPGAQIGGQ